MVIEISLTLSSHFYSQAFHDSEEKDEGEHKINVFKSCVIMAGIYVFFSIECILKARLSRKNGARKKAHDCDDVTEPEKMVRVFYSCCFQKLVASSVLYHAVLLDQALLRSTERILFTSSFFSAGFSMSRVY